METYSEMLEHLVNGLRKIYGDLIVSIVLYGSVARGTQTEESDIDIAMLLKNGQTSEMHDKMLDHVVDLELEYNKIISVLRIDYNEFQQWEDYMPFFKNVKKEGIVLWTAA